MKSPGVIFFEIPCLTEKSKQLKGRDILRKWFKGADLRNVAEYMQKFRDYNRQLFGFLEVEPFIEGSGNDISLSFTSGKYVGAIPLRSPHSGNQTGDFIVRPKYTSNEDQFRDYVELVNYLQTVVSLEFRPSLPLCSTLITPPLYLAAAKYIRKLEVATRINWPKFHNKKKVFPYPKPRVQWTDYANQYSDPSCRLKFNCSVNNLKKFHDELSEIKYVYGLTKKEILSPNTPPQIKIHLSPIMQYLETYLSPCEERMTQHLVTRSSDPPDISELKNVGNTFLSSGTSETTAWRIDFSVLFERFVQHLFQQVANEIGADLLQNYKIRRIGRKSAPWILDHLEPDIALFKEIKEGNKHKDMEIMVDAKYKSHFYNLQTQTESLRDEHRADLHQLLAYCSFSSQKNKVGFLCYPWSRVGAIRGLSYNSPRTNVSNNIILLGIPLEVAAISEIKSTIIDCIDQSVNRVVSSNLNDNMWSG